MPAATRVTDISMGMCSCCCSSCPHQWISVHSLGSPNVFLDKRPVMRAPGDLGSSSCPHCPTSWSVTGSGSVRVNKLRLHRLGDVHVVACGTGIVVSASGSTGSNRRR